MAIPTADEIGAIRDKMVQSHSERSVNRWAAEYDEDIDMLLAANEAVNVAFDSLRRCATCDRTGGVSCFGYSCEECTLEMTAERDRLRSDLETLKAKLDAVTAERDRLRGGS